MKNVLSPDLYQAIINIIEHFHQDVLDSLRKQLQAALQRGEGIMCITASTEELAVKLLRRKLTKTRLLSSEDCKTITSIFEKARGSRAQNPIQLLEEKPNSPVAKKMHEEFMLCFEEDLKENFHIIEEGHSQNRHRFSARPGIRGSSTPILIPSAPQEELRHGAHPGF